MKTTYIAIDPAGGKHTRSTVRDYSHTVVIRPSYEHALAEASAKHHPQQDRRNWEYYVAIIDGRDPYPEQPWRAKNPDRWTPAQIEEERVYMERRTAEKLAAAKAEIGEPDQGLGAYLTKKHTARTARVEKLKADGYFDRWLNAGWCGRLDLAQKLAGAERARAAVAEAVVLDAVEKVKADA